MRLNIGTFVLAVLALGFLLVRNGWVPQPWTSSQIMGLVITVLAAVCFVLARIQLGRAFSVQAKATTLVTSGIYSRIRNPIYVFGGLMIAGFLVFARRPWALLIFVVLIPLQLFRIRQEERVLEDKFGEEYRAYKRSTWF